MVLFSVLFCPSPPLTTQSSLYQHNSKIKLKFFAEMPSQTVFTCGMCRKIHLLVTKPYVALQSLIIRLLQIIQGCDFCQVLYTSVFLRIHTISIASTVIYIQISLNCYSCMVCRQFHVAWQNWDAILVYFK